MRRASVAFVVVFAAGLVLLLVVGLLQQRSEAFTLGVAPVAPLTLPRDAEVCQRSIDPATIFSRVELEVDSGRRSPPLFEVRVLAKGRPLADGRSAGVLGGRRAVVVTVGEVPARGPISVCLHNTGRRRFDVYGNSGMAHPGSAAFLDGEPVDYDLDLTFLRPTNVSLISLAGDMVRRASLFRGEWIGTWSLWLVAVLLLTAFPLLLYLALQAVGR